MRHGFFAVTRLHLGYILGYIMPKRQYGLYGKYGLYVPIFNKDLLNYLHYMDNMHQKDRFDDSSTPIASTSNG